MLHKPTAPDGPCGCCDMGTYAEMAMLNRKAREFSVLSTAEREASIPRCKKFDRPCEGAKDFSSAIARIDKETANAE
jgi:hypothetical protein